MSEPGDQSMEILPNTMSRVTNKVDVFSQNVKAILKPDMVTPITTWVAKINFTVKSKNKKK
jgi:hypothetical protein